MQERYYAKWVSLYARPIKVRNRSSSFSAPYCRCCCRIQPTALHSLTMVKHFAYLKNVCRLCGNNVKSKADVAIKSAFKRELLDKFNINIDADSREIHPEKVCPPCKQILYRVRESGNAIEINVSRTIEKCTCHVENNCRCTSGKKGRPPKKRVHRELSRELIGSDTESGEEYETETERNSCMEFKSLIENIPLMEMELAMVCAQKLAETFNLIFLDRENIASSVSSLSDRDKIALTQSIFSREKGNIRTDILTCNQTYKSLPVLLKVSPEGWSQSRNPLLACVVNAISNKSTKPVHKAVTIDQLYSLVQPSFISPLLFAANLLIYSVTRSKLALTICDKLHPAGSIACVRTWLNNLIMNVPQVPSGDLLTAIDNDQVLIKKWTVRKDNRAQISVLTSVCVVPVHPNGTLQWNGDLAPG